MKMILRKDLYEKVWNKPITHIAKEYGVSDSAIIKICKKMEVPRPGPGYWTKVECGKTVKKAKLTKLSKSGLTEYHLVPNRSRSSGSNNNDKNQEHNPLIQYELDPMNLIHACGLGNEPNSLYMKNLKSFSNATANERQVLCPRAKTHFKLKVTKNTLDRALIIMNALVKAFEKREWSFKCVNDPDLKMYVVILDELIEFTIEEKSKQVDHVLTDQEIKAKNAGRYIWPPNWDYIPTGKLMLKIDNARSLIPRHSWNDGKIQRVEDCLNKFCIAAIELAEAIKVDRAKREAERIQREEEQARRHQLRQLRDHELALRKLFEDHFDAWYKAERIRAFITASAKREVLLSIVNEYGKSKSEWLKWASNIADLIDPLCEAEKTIIEETEDMFKYWY